MAAGHLYNEKSGGGALSNSALVDDNTPRRIRPLREDEIKSAIANEIRDALGNEQGQLAEDRRMAIQYYYGKPFGNEQAGRSNMVLTDVADTIEWIMPSLMRMFIGSGIIWRFKPHHPSQERAAEQATMAVNHMFMNQMNGYMVLYDWFKTALLEKNSFVHPVWEELYEPKQETYYGQTETEVGKIMENKNATIIALEVHDGEGLYDINTKQQLLTYDVTTFQTSVVGGMQVYGVPPEEFLITRRSVRLDDQTPYAAHRRKLTVSQLVTMGYDPEMLVRLPSDEKPEWDLGRTERFSNDETWIQYTSDRVDPASRDLWVTDSYIHLDEDGDGYAELRHIMSVGDQAVHILSDERANFMPFCSLCPVPMPYKFFGMSIADLTMDLQLIRSTLARQVLDSTYLANTPRWLVQDGAEVDVDALLTSVPGGIVLTEDVNAVVPLTTQPIPQQAFQLLEYLEGVMEKRTGATKWMIGTDASALKDTTLGGVTEAMRASGQKIEMIASIFGQTGVKELGVKMYRLMIENASRPQIMRIANEWVEVDPSTWGDTMDLEVEVGLGVGQAASRMNNLSMVADRQKQLLEHPNGAMLVSPQNIYNLANAFTEAMGMIEEDKFFTNPQGQPWPEPAPDADVEVRNKESDRRAREDSAQAAIASTKVALESATQDQLQVYRAADMDSTERMKYAELQSRERIAKAQIAAQIQSSLLANNPNEGAQA